MSLVTPSAILRYLVTPLLADLKIVTLAPPIPPNAIFDEDGSAMTDENGNVITF